MTDERPLSVSRLLLIFTLQIGLRELASPTVCLLGSQVFVGTYTGVTSRTDVSQRGKKHGWVYLRDMCDAFCADLFFDIGALLIL